MLLDWADFGKFVCVHNRAVDRYFSLHILHNVADYGGSMVFPLQQTCRQGQQHLCGMIRESAVMTFTISIFEELNVIA